MYVYLIKCSNFYKIGYSKNPKNRLATIQTHNPLSVKICATLKTEKYQSLEKELHNSFLNKRTRGEWFELKNDDLMTLKIDYGFDFKISISEIFDDEKYSKNKTLEETKKYRIDSHKIEYFISFFQNVFDCHINDYGEIRRCCVKFDKETITKSIDSLYNQGYEPQKAYNTIYKVCNNIKQIQTNPADYITKIVKAIYYKHYDSVLSFKDINYISENYNTDLNADDVIKSLNSKKFLMDEDEFWYFIKSNFTKY